MNTELFPARSNLLRTINTVSIASSRAPQFGDEPIRTLDFTGTGIEIVWWTSSTDWMTFQKCHRLHAALVLPPDQNGDCLSQPFAGSRQILGGPGRDNVKNDAANLYWQSLEAAYGL